MRASGWRSSFSGTSIRARCRSDRTHDPRHVPDPAHVCASDRRHLASKHQAFLLADDEGSRRWPQQFVSDRPRRRRDHRCAPECFGIWPTTAISIGRKSRRLEALIDNAIYLQPPNSRGVYRTGYADSRSRRACLNSRRSGASFRAGAADKGVRLAFQNCAMDGKLGDWVINTAANPDAGELMFDAVPLPRARTETRHQLVDRIDPMPQIRNGSKSSMFMQDERDRALYGWNMAFFCRSFICPDARRRLWRHGMDVITNNEARRYGRSNPQITRMDDPAYREELEMRRARSVRSTTSGNAGARCPLRRHLVERRLHRRRKD